MKSQFKPDFTDNFFTRDLTAFKATNWYLKFHYGNSELFWSNMGSPVNSKIQSQIFIPEHHSNVSLEQLEHQAAIK